MDEHVVDWFHRQMVYIDTWDIPSTHFDNVISSIETVKRLYPEEYVIAKMKYEKK